MSGRFVSVEIVEAVQRTTDASCDVCGTSMATGSLVRCAKCRTPHHKDYWDFNRKCAVFGCGEVRSGA
jgi:hypothetical protein